MSDWTNAAIAFAKIVNWYVFALAVAALVLYWHMRQADRARGSFKFQDFYCDANGHGDNKALAYMSTVFACVWILVYQTVHDQLTEWFVTSVLGFVSAVSGFKSWVAASRDKALAQTAADAGPTAPTASQEIRTVLKDVPLDQASPDADIPDVVVKKGGKK